jgi:hypothetical protein
MGFRIWVEQPSMYTRFPEREPSPFYAATASEIDFAGDRLVPVLHEVSGAVIELLGPVMWAALIVLFIDAEFFSHW